MKFTDDISKDERDDWRKHPVTQAMFDMLRAQAEQHNNMALVELNSGRPEQARHVAGQAVGIQTALYLMEKDE